MAVSAHVRDYLAMAGPEILAPSRHVPALRKYYDALFAAYGPQHWWPGRSRFEIIVGAILTQHTAWSNVEPVIRKLRHEKVLSPTRMRLVPLPRLQKLIRSSGFFRQKARNLKAFVSFLFSEYSGSLNKMFRAPTPRLREQLLAIRGIGPETADSILLYAGRHPVFVIDAYARRLLERHQLAEPRHSYEHLRTLFECSVPRDVALYNEFHALIVRAGKDHCRAKNPRCSECPLRAFLPVSAFAHL